VTLIPSFAVAQAGFQTWTRNQSRGTWPSESPPDLHASGPGSVALVPDCGVHRGTVTITVRKTVHIEQSGVGDNSPIRRSDVSSALGRRPLLLRYPG